jgi:DNA-binding transcriptional ArsR family regulator
LSTTAAELDRVLAAAAEDTRRGILDLLARSGPLRAGDIARRFSGISRPAVSRHLRVLREAGLVNERRPAGADGREQWYSAELRRLEIVQQWVRHYEVYWNGKLDELERLLESDTLSDGPDAGESGGRD